MTRAGRLAQAIAPTRRWSRDAWLLLTGTLLISVGSYLVTPFLAIYFLQRGLSPAVVAAAFVAKLWGQRGLMVVGGWASDRWGSRAGLRVGLVARVVSYGVLALPVLPATALAGTFLLGASSGFYIPAGKTALASYGASAEELDELYMLRNVANSAGNTLGPAAGAVLVLLGARVSLVTAAAVFLAVTVLMWNCGPRDRAADPSSPGATPAARTSLAPSRTFVWLLTAWVLFGLAYYQIDTAVPVFVSQHVSAWFVGAVFTTSSLLVVILQVPLSRATRFWTVRSVCLVGLGGFAAAFAVLSLGTWWAALAGIAVFSAMEVLVEPRIDRAVAEVVPRYRQGTAFGLCGVAQAGGGSVANLAPALVGGAAAVGSGYWLGIAAAEIAGGASLYGTAPRRLENSAGPTEAAETSGITHAPGPTGDRVEDVTGKPG